MKHLPWIACVVLVVIMVISWLSVNIGIRRDVYGWRDASYASANADQMEFYLGKLIAGMEKHGMTHGHYAVLLKNPANDMAIDLTIFRGLRERAKAVQKYPQGSMDYAQTLADIRTQMSTTSFDPVKWWWVQNHCFLYALFVYVLSWLIPLPAAIYYFWLILDS
jgi:hypothetical protein